jgi:hypothetical protein
MSPKPHTESTAHSPLWLALILVILMCFPMLHARAAKTGKVRGVIFTIGSHRVRTLWPNAHVSLKNLETNRVISAVSDDLAAYAFIGVTVALYEITVTLAGFEPGAKRFTLQGGDLPLDVQLFLKEHKETVTVHVQPSGVDLTSSSGGTPELTQDILKSVIRLNQDFHAVTELRPFLQLHRPAVASFSISLSRVSKGGDCIKGRARDRRTHSSKYRAPALYGSRPGWRAGSAGVLREPLRTAVAKIG